MISAWVIVFREVLEMSLVVGVLLAATAGAQHSRRWIALGMGAGALGALLVAWLMEAMEASMDGNGEFVFNAVVLSVAALLLAWTVLWMSQHGRAMSQQMKQMGTSVASGELPATALFVVTLAAVMREGSEAVFFLFGAAQESQADGWSMLQGGLLGLLSGVVLGAVLYFGLLKIPLKHLFSVLSWLLMLLAAGMASQAALNLTLIDALPVLVDTVWDSSSWLSMESMMGEFLHVMMGYDDHPNAMQVLVFVLFFVGVSLLKKHREMRG